MKFLGVRNLAEAAWGSVASDLERLKAFYSPLCDEDCAWLGFVAYRERASENIAGALSMRSARDHF